MTIDDRCVMAISTSYDQVDRSSWYRFWEAATAINAMCVRHGKAGYWRNRDVISKWRSGSLLQRELSAGMMS